MKEMIIALPPKLYVLRPAEKQDIRIDTEEYNIYFDNMILPYSEQYDVKIQCEYGKNYGTFWRINTFPYDRDSFPLKVMVYDEWGEKLAEKECTVIMTDKQEEPENYNVMCIGDSMTHSVIYVNHISHKLKNLAFKGSRSFDGHIFVEGRGGWSYMRYFDDHTRSPFLFPKDIEAEQYYGDFDFERMKSNTEGLTYAFKGFHKYELLDDMIYHKEEKLWQFSKGEHSVINEKPEWEFSFEKYMKRYNPGQVDAVSILLGANDLGSATYENCDEMIAQYLTNTEKFIEGIRNFNATLPIILNLPIAGADQLGWGKVCGCNGTTKQYKYVVINAAQAIIDQWGDSKDNIYLSAMSLNLDRKRGFRAEMYKANRYSDYMMTGQDNNVHPNQVGYMQMGDALAAVIEYVRKI